MVNNHFLFKHRNNKIHIFENNINDYTAKTRFLNYFQKVLTYNLTNIELMVGCIRPRKIGKIHRFVVFVG